MLDRETPLLVLSPMKVVIRVSWPAVKADVPATPTTGYRGPFDEVRPWIAHQGFSALVGLRFINPPWAPWCRGGDVGLLFLRRHGAYFST